MQYDLLQLEKKSEQKIQKMQKQIIGQDWDRSRVEALRDKERRDIVREKRDMDKQVRQLSIDRAELVRQKELTVTQSARLAHEKNLLVGNNKRMKRNMFSTKIALVLEKKVSFFACLFQHVIR